MRAFLDACVLYPVATREILLAYARGGGFEPLWSLRVLEEWRRAAAFKLSSEEGARAEGDAALLGAWFPKGCVMGWEAREVEAFSPDPADAHVIAAAATGGAATILTFNIRDFPLKSLRPFDLTRAHPDAFLQEALIHDTDRMVSAIRPIALRAEARGATCRGFLKRAALPRLGKAWERLGV